MQNIEIEYTKKYVQRVLERLYYFKKVAENGNTDAIVIVTDILEAAKRCDFTDSQKRVFKLRYLLEYTQAEIAEEMGISHQGVDKHLGFIVNKVFNIVNGEV